MLDHMYLYRPSDGCRPSRTLQAVNKDHLHQSLPQLCCNCALYLNNYIQLSDAQHVIQEYIESEHNRNLINSIKSLKSKRQMRYRCFLRAIKNERSINRHHPTPDSSRESNSYPDGDS